MSHPPSPAAVAEFATRPTTWHLVQPAVSASWISDRTREWAP
jgi:hypothetical protein